MVLELNPVKQSCRQVKKSSVRVDLTDSSQGLANSVQCLLPFTSKGKALLQIDVVTKLNGKLDLFLLEFFSSFLLLESIAFTVATLRK